MNLLQRRRCAEERMMGAVVADPLGTLSLRHHQLGKIEQQAHASTVLKPPSGGFLHSTDREPAKTDYSEPLPCNLPPKG